MTVLTQYHLLTPNEACRLTGWKNSKLKYWADQGKFIWVTTIGGHRRYDEASLLEFASRLPEEKYKNMKHQ